MPDCTLSKLSVTTSGDHPPTCCCHVVNVLSRCRLHESLTTLLQALHIGLLLGQQLSGVTTKVLQDTHRQRVYEVEGWDTDYGGESLHCS